ncbi:MAG: DUF1275 domain-containing protein [Streptococcaceae bacterium]|jgi:uncharacterized membrane protein YoaK (UPF0700 family)|nr:DUF1275 domain-containing protein [Streptococcaceae bacterium]
MADQKHEKLRVALLLSLGAGYMDGFTFFHFNGRFAGAQTGNIIQAGIALARGEFLDFWNFVIPILFFVLGVMVKIFFEHFLQQHRRPSTLYLLLFQLLGLTAFVLIFILAVPELPAAIVVGVLSFFMAIQFDTFNKAHGRGYTSVFTTGNLKILSVNVAQYLITHEKSHLEYAKLLFWIIPCFFVGAFVATLLVSPFGNWALLVNCIDLLIVYIIIRTEA